MKYYTIEPLKFKKISETQWKAETLALNYSIYNTVNNQWITSTSNIFHEYFGEIYETYEEAEKVLQGMHRANALSCLKEADSFKDYEKWFIENAETIRDSIPGFALFNKTYIDQFLANKGEEKK